MNAKFGKFGLYLSVASVLAVAAATSASGASPMDTCIQAFVAEALPQGHPVKVVKREMSDLYYNHQPAKKIVVKSKGKRSGKSYGAATCYLDDKGGLLAMHVEGERVRVAQASAAPRKSGG